MTATFSLLPLMVILMMMKTTWSPNFSFRIHIRRSESRVESSSSSFRLIYSFRTTFTLLLLPDARCFVAPPNQEGSTE